MYRILYVDDEPGLLDLGRFFLEEDGGFAVETKSSATEALRHLDTVQYDAIVSDYEMPQMNGIAFLKKLREGGNNTPFVIFTGRGREEVVIEALNSGADFYIQKGGDPTSQFVELTHKIRLAISRRKAEEELRQAYERIAASEEKLRQQFEELAKTELQVRQREIKYRTLVEVNRDIIYSFDPDGIIRYMSPQTTSHLGFDPDEMIGKAITEFIHPDDTGRVLRNVENNKKNGSHFTSKQFQILRKDRTYRWFEDNTIFTLDHRGRPIFIGTLRDITGRKNDEKALFESRQMLRLVLDNIPQRVFWKGTDLAFLGCNRTLANDVGYENPDAMIGRTDYDHSSAAIAEHFRADDRAVMDTGISKINFEEPQIRPDGSTAWLRTSKVPLRDQEGRIIGVLGTYEDITKEKQARIALEESEELYRVYFRTTQDPVFITNRDGSYVDCNDAFMAHLGIADRASLGSLNITDALAHPEDRLVLLGMLIHDGYIRQYPVDFKRADGTTGKAFLTALPHKNHDGEIRLYIGTIRVIP